MVELTYRQHRALLAALKILVIVSLAFLFSWLVANYVGFDPSGSGLYGAAIASVGHAGG